MKKTLNALIATALICNMMNASYGWEKAADFVQNLNNAACKEQNPCAAQYS